MSIVGLIGIALGLALLIFMAFKGYEAAYMAIIAVVLVALFNGLDIIQAVGTTMFQGASEFFSMMGAMILCSCVFAGIFSACGAAQSLANGFVWFFDKILGKKNKDSYMRGVWITLLVSYFAYTILTFFGLDGQATQITLVPVVIALMRQYNIPRHCAPALLYVNVSGVFLPYSLQTTNMIPTFTLGTTTGVGGWPAFLIWALSAAAALIYLMSYIRKCHNRGDVFESLPIDDTPQGERKLPPFILALLPLVLIFVLYTVVGWHIAIVLLIATAFSMLTMFPFFSSTAKTSGKKFLELLKDRISTQVTIAAKILLVVCLLVGFGSVVQSTEVFGQVVAALTHPSGGLIITCAFALMVVILVSCNPVAGEGVALNVLAPAFTAAGVSPAIFHRLTVIASTTFDSLPTGVGVIMAHELTGVKMRDGYKPIFIITVVIPFIGTLLMALLYMLFPMAA